MTIGSIVHVLMYQAPFLFGCIKIYCMAFARSPHICTLAFLEDHIYTDTVKNGQQTLSTLGIFIHVCA